ncbi:two-component sensor histidine kinase, partial [Streptomyces coeruleorubidus]
MTETTQTHTTPPGGGAQPRSPEFRLALDALRGLRQDLIDDAFAYRPLPRMRVDGPLTRLLPQRLREYAGWTPHVLVVVAALLSMSIAAMADGSDGGFDELVTTALVLCPVLLTLVRPVGAFWLSL